MVFISSILFVLSLVILVIGSKSKDCTTFLTNGSISNTFEYYRFYDFRNVYNSSGAAVNTSDTNSLATSRIVNDTSWTDDWNIRVQSKAAPNDDAIPMKYISSNVQLENTTDVTSDYTTHLTLTTNRLKSFQQAAELDYTQTNLTHASIRVLARVSGAPGAVAGLFTYHNDTTESDIEIRTQDPTTAVQYSNQPTTDSADAAIPGSTYNVTAPAWTAWHVYRLDWVSGRSVWFVDGVQSADTSVNVPATESMFILNMWSNGGAWSGDMEVGMKAVLQVQWVEMAFNVSGESAGSSSSDRMVCSIEKKVGMPMEAMGTILGLTPGRLLFTFSVVLAVCLINL